MQKDGQILLFSGKILDRMYIYVKIKYEDTKTFPDGKENSVKVAFI